MSTDIEYHREWRKKNRDKVKAAKDKYLSTPGGKAWAAEYQRQRRRHSPVKLAVDVLKAAPCTDCGQRYPAAVMEFDHRDPSTKTADVSRLAGRFSISAVMAEIAKCDLVCANCHRLRELARRLDKQETSQPQG